MATAKPAFEVHGHRGARAVFPENTLESFRYALEQGVDAIEVDIALTRDRVPVILHDSALNTTLYRWNKSGVLSRLDTTKPLLVKDFSFEQLSVLDIGSVVNPNFPTQTPLAHAKVPTLDDFVGLMLNHPHRAKLNIEIKTDPLGSGDSHDPEEFADQILAVLRARRVPVERVLFQSFDPAALIALKDRDESWTASFLTEAWTDDIPEVALDLGVEAVSPRFDLLDVTRAKLLREAGLEIYVWTPNTVEEWARLADLGVDGIITDDPKACLSFRQNRDC